MALVTAKEKKYKNGELNIDIHIFVLCVDNVNLKPSTTCICNLASVVYRLRYNVTFSDYYVLLCTLCIHLIN